MDSLCVDERSRCGLYIAQSVCLSLFWTKLLIHLNSLLIVNPPLLREDTTKSEALLHVPLTGLKDLLHG
ncbi:hypothetical protein MPTK1_2g15710 [Marchantia polymorpha subsp. ruderalis]|uniref:Uncharacterized protein n=1 Tax=Marchantia polymorpha TaxID=3197 RepID=A0A2R6WK46_MARPO|nr:hypothetical protein MARPO_0082s0068 [Marchantia polymorpha]BBN02489.1 hypothetical protein Mp_2g15710 [Marchantia polymorpha subsp. ruderalis]|eukprot:PTQ34237.1 hypothetical protein MARPO_0082s0068 [Marchantia polymorpha]